MANINVLNNEVTVPGSDNIVAGQTFTVAFDLNNREAFGGGEAGCTTEVEGSQAGSVTVAGHIANVSIEVVYPDQSTDTVTGMARVSPSVYRKGPNKVCVPTELTGNNVTVEFDLVAPDPGEYGIVAQVESAGTTNDSATKNVTILEPQDADQPGEGSGGNGGNGDNGNGGIDIPGGGNGDNDGNDSSGSTLANFIINRPVEAGVIGLSAAFIADRSISALFED